MSSHFARNPTLFDATMIVISGIIGSRIFINPDLVAQRVGTPFLILAVWAAGGAIALAGVELSAEPSLENNELKPPHRLPMDRRPRSYGDAWRAHFPARSAALDEDPFPQFTP